MPTIAELTGAQPVPNGVHPPPNRHPDGVPHAFWGDPPSIAACEEWLPLVLAAYEDTQRKLAFSNTGGRIVGDDGLPLKHEEFAAWRRDTVWRGQKFMRRYRFLKSWKAKHAHLALEAREAAKPEDQAAIARANGYALKKAARRYGKLEELFFAATTIVEDESDEAWNRFLAALDEVAAADNPATEGGA